MTPSATSVFLRSDSDYFPEETDMQFRLTYEGELKSDGRPDHKHRVRRVFHAQLSPTASRAAAF